ncbi:MAG TPA: type 2 isopentenyl-diphosphate Delta-isomerase [Thermoanaerobaculia bacterium]|nr:type 2 isopentenyl-diphosphate Delta-isomerase [Thermoanaerobaculia bacterium]
MSAIETKNEAAEETAMNDRDRKAEHIELALDRRTQLDRHFFDEWAFDHQALPEIDRAEVDVSTRFLGKELSAPLLISCMTGGTEIASEINRNLAVAAERRGIAVGVGSQRKALEDAETTGSFEMRDAAPTVPLLANLGAVQLNYGYGLAECERAVEMVRADALVLHLNALQEAIQPEGQCDFSTLLPKMRQVAAELSVPVIAKEVGCGMTGETAARLAEAGIGIVDVAGLGGTSWARIEAARADDHDIGELFADWGVPTPRSIRECAAVPGMTVIGSGGVRNGLDVAKAIALGADLVGMAFPFLAAAMESPERVEAKVARTVEELTIAMFCLGTRNIEELKQVPIHRRGER